MPKPSPSFANDVVIQKWRLAPNLKAFKFGASLHFCMTTSLANDGEGLGTVGLPKSKVEELCAAAGFKNVKEIEINHPLNSLFVIQ